MNNKYRMYVTSIAIKFLRDTEIYRNADREISNFASSMAARCYEELARINNEEK